jgi:hypothetical protein
MTDVERRATGAEAAASCRTPQHNKNASRLLGSLAFPAPQARAHSPTAVPGPVPYYGVDPNTFFTASRLEPAIPFFLPLPRTDTDLPSMAGDVGARAA